MGAYSNQRSESLHPGTTDILNKQLSLEAASRRLGKTIQSKLRELTVEETESGGKLPYTLDQRAFVLLADTVSFEAISKISPEWETTKEELLKGSLYPKTACSCELLIRFGLPCRHYLALPCQNGAPIPQSLIHPRWWIHGPLIQFSEWIPLYRTFTLPISPLQPSGPCFEHPYLSPQRNKITGLGLQVLGARDSLTGYARTRYDLAATNAQQGLLEFAQDLRHDDLHTRMPDIVKRSGWNQQFKSHNKVNKRLITGAEAAERDANKREQAEA